MSKFGARTREKNARALEQLEAHGTKVSARIVDVSKEENIVAGVAATLQEFGRIDSCFANAGVSNRWKSFLDIGGDNYRRFMSINLDGVMWTLREACRHMKARAERGDPGGSIVTIASMGAIWGSPRSEDYSATKAAVIAVTNGIAVEFARYGVRANSILPGWIATDMTVAAQENEVLTKNVSAVCRTGAGGNRRNSAALQSISPAMLRVFTTAIRWSSTAVTESSDASVTRSSHSHS